MKSINQIIGRAENLLCVVDRCGLENEICSVKYYTVKQREKQRLIIYDWLKLNNYIQFMTSSERRLFEKKVGNPLIKYTCHKKFFESEAIEPLLWTLGLIKKLSSYEKYTLTSSKDFDQVHSKLKVDVPNTHQELLREVIVQNEKDILLQNQIAMLWYWRAIEGNKPMSKKIYTPKKVLDVFGSGYEDAIKYIFSEPSQRDFKVGKKYVYELNFKEVQHLYKRAKWRYYAFEWLLSEDDWENVQLNT